MQSCSKDDLLSFELILLKAFLEKKQEKNNKLQERYTVVDDSFRQPTGMHSLKLQMKKHIC